METYIWVMTYWVKQVENKKKREVSVEYYIGNEGNLVKVCQHCFLNVYGENHGFVIGIIDKKKKSTTGIIERDERGRHKPKIKHSNEAIAYVRNHISKSLHTKAIIQDDTQRKIPRNWVKFTKNV